VNSKNDLPLPRGYSTWLDYAVETFDTRGLWVESLFGDERVPLDRDAVRGAAQEELRLLRAMAARGKEDLR